MSMLREPLLEARDVVRLIRELVPDRVVEGLLIIGLGGDRRVSGVGVNQRHRALSFVKVWELSALAAELDATSLVVATFPTGESRTPSAHEIDAFAALAIRAYRAGVMLLDCIILREERWWSLCELGLARANA